MVVRLDYEASYRRLHELGWPIRTRPADPQAQTATRRRRAARGVSFFRTRVGDDLRGLTLPRTFFGRSEIKGASFHGTDLRESNLCWNDFVDVDFSQTVLSNSDLRARCSNVYLSRRPTLDVPTFADPPSRTAHLIVRR